MMRGSSLGAHETSSHAPPRSLSDFESTRPSRLTPPASATSAAKVREKPSIFASAASTRVPSSPSGTGRLRDSTSVLRRGARSVVGRSGRLVRSGVVGFVVRVCAAASRVPSKRSPISTRSATPIIIETMKMSATL